MISNGWKGKRRLGIYPFALFNQSVIHILFANIYFRSGGLPVDTLSYHDVAATAERKIRYRLTIHAVTHFSHTYLTLHQVANTTIEQLAIEQRL